MHSPHPHPVEANTQHSHFGAQVKHYGNSAAVCFQSSLLNDRVPTLNIEIAAIVDHAPRWQEKLNFQLSENELPLFCGLMLGFLPSLAVRRGTKGVELTRQKREGRNEPGLFVSATAGRAHQHRLLVPTGIMAKIGALALSRFTQELGVEASLAMPAIRAACALHH